MKKADNKDEKLNMNLSWKILDETTVIKDSWIDMRASTCQLPGGMDIAPFYVNHLPDFAVVVAVTPEHKVILVRQYRHGVEKVLLELPAGCIEPGEDPKDGAARELLEETGYKGPPSRSWYGIFAPAGTPRPIVDLLNKELRALLQNEDVSGRVATEGGDVVPSSPEEYAAVIAREEAVWSALIKRLNLKVE